MITPIFNVNINRNYYSPRLKPNVFSPSVADSVSFTSANLLKLSSEQITKQVVSAISKVNCIGTGREGIVYRIPDSDYCVKLIKRNPFNMTNFGDWNFNIDKTDAANHVCARAENGAVIMRFIEGQPLKFFSDQHEIASLPKSSYISLLKQVSDAESLGLAFDSAPANIIYNSENKSLTAIDFYRPNFNFGIYPFTQVFSALENTATSYQNILLNKKIAGNLLNIALDGYEYKTVPMYKLSDGDITRFVSRFKKSYSQLLPSQFEFIQNTLREISELKALERNGEDISAQLSEKIEYARALIREILTGEK